MISGDLHIELRCPACRGLDWYRSGIQIHEPQDGVLEILEVARLDLATDPQWSCALCAHEAPAWSTLGKRLDGLVGFARGDAP